MMEALQCGRGSEELFDKGDLDPFPVGQEVLFQDVPDEDFRLPVGGEAVFEVRPVPAEFQEVRLDVGLAGFHLDGEGVIDLLDDDVDIVLFQEGESPLFQVMVLDLFDIVAVFETAPALVEGLLSEGISSLQAQFVEPLAVDGQGNDQPHGFQFFYHLVAIGDGEPQVSEALDKADEGFEFDVFQYDPSQGGKCFPALNTVNIALLGQWRVFRAQILQIPGHARLQIFIGDRALSKGVVFDGEQDRPGEPIGTADALPQGQHGEIPSFVLPQEHGIGQGRHILVEGEGQGEFGGKVPQGAHGHLAGMLVDDDDRLAQFAYLPHDDIGDVFLLPGLQEQVVGLFDDDEVLQRLPFGLPHAVVVDPEEQAAYDEGLIGIGKAVQFQNDLLRQKLRDGVSLPAVDHFAQSRIIDGVQGPLDAGPPEELSRLFPLLQDLVLHLLEGVETGAFHEHIIGAGSQQVHLLDDLGELFDPDIPFHTLGTRLGVELEGNHLFPADGEDHDVALLEIGMLQEVPVVALVIEDQEGSVLVAEVFQYPHHERGLAASRLAEDAAVPDPFPIPNAEDGI